MIYSDVLIFYRIKKDKYFLFGNYVFNIFASIIDFILTTNYKLIAVLKKSAIFTANKTFKSTLIEVSLPNQDNQKTHETSNFETNCLSYVNGWSYNCHQSAKQR